MIRHVFDIFTRGSLESDSDDDSTVPLSPTVPAQLALAYVTNNRKRCAVNDDSKLPVTFSIRPRLSKYPKDRLLSVVSLDSSNDQPVVSGTANGDSVRLLLDQALHAPAAQGDYLYLKKSRGNKDHPGWLTADSVAFTRWNDDMFARIVGHHQTLDGQSFVLFQNSICCASDVIPEGAPSTVGSLYKVSTVESTQPRGCSWRAWKVEVPSPKERENFPDVAVDERLSFETISFGSSVSKTVTINNQSQYTPVMLTRIAVYGCPQHIVSPVHISDPYKDDDPVSYTSSLHFQPFRTVNYRLECGMQIQVNVRICGTNPGKWNFLLRFYFGHKLTRECAVTAEVLQQNGSPGPVPVAEIGMLLKDGGRFLGKSSAARQAQDRQTSLEQARNSLSFVRAPRSETPDDEKASKMDPFRIRYTVPDKLAELLSDMPESEAVVSTFPVLGQSLAYENYSSKLHVLMHLEEYQEQLDLHSFDVLSDKLFHLEGTTYRLELAGLQENRPSLVSGDFVVAKGIDDIQGPSFEGRISSVEMEAVVIQFSESFQEFFEEHKMLDLTFVINRSVYRRLHNILAMAVNNISQRLLFPSAANRDNCVRRIEESQRAEHQDLAWFNAALNDQQRQAVRNIVIGRCRPLAHIIFGPPGTGKTTTVVETALQIYTRWPKSVILICAPSNSGTDLVGQRIMQSGVVPATALRRILGYSRRQEIVPIELTACVQTGCDELLTSEHRIVLTTCQAATFFAQQLHDFSHIIIDEAGFATEPETLPPLAVTAGRPDVQVVLAGDPCQLGPVVRSKYAKRFGLEKSLLSRLLELEAYQAPIVDTSDPASRYCPALVSKLDLSYRAVDSLLKISSRFFYNCQLTTNLREEDNTLAPRLGLPPLTFWPVRSREMRESRSPSTYNPGQVEVVLRLFRHLLTVDTQVEQIGILTPYRLQSEHIRRTLSDCGLPLPKVGTVDEFQGQERDAIIFSTVRARKFEEDEEVENLKAVMGFVACPKRINVALTRARYVMMIVGDPRVLALDKHWRGILRYIISQGAYQEDLYNNCPYPAPALLSPDKRSARTARDVPCDDENAEDVSLN